MSGYFHTTIGVKQGGVLRPVLFCMCIDGCYIGLNYVRDLAYADGAVILAP